MVHTSKEDERRHEHWAALVHASFAAQGKGEDGAQQEAAAAREEQDLHDQEVVPVVTYMDENNQVKWGHEIRTLKEV